MLKHKDWVIAQDNIGSLSQTNLIFVTYSYLQIMGLVFTIKHHILYGEKGYLYF